jgi:hypothetical protein
MAYVNVAHIAVVGTEKHINGFSVNSFPSVLIQKSQDFVFVVAERYYLVSPDCILTVLIYR